MNRILAGIKAAGAAMAAQNGHLAAQAIMTTDTFAKEMAVEFDIAGQTVKIGAMAKGSGMIHPNMATMLGFLTTDAAITKVCLQQALQEANADSFNMVTVDGDTSTNDMLAILANGCAGNNEIVDVQSTAYRSFCTALTYVCKAMAQLIARDGEGASKLIEIQVKEARSQADARKVARSIATSNLVKTAVYGEDANWGRIFCAAGYSGATFVPEKVNIYMGDLQVAHNGMALPFDEARAKAILQESEVLITLHLNDGECSATAWTCDFTYDYVKINASYRS
jgi:glutamate N-acetyltransferase/amino-acid N-acetyltransferase